VSLLLTHSCGTANVPQVLQLVQRGVHLCALVPQGFTYSSANKNSGITWNEETLYSYLKNPKKVISYICLARGCALRKVEF